MSLAAEVVGILGNENANLADALVKTRILASKLGNKQLADWCRYELSGYPSDVEVPPYRRIVLTLLGTISNGYYRYPNRPLPTLHLEPEQREYFTRASVRQGISAIQAWIGKDVVTNFSVDMGLLFNKVLDDTYQVESLFGRPPVGAHEQILVEIRARLLEFALEVQETLPPDDALPTPISNDMNDKINNLLNGAVFGDNNVLQIGREHVATVSYGVAPGDLAALIGALQKAGMAEDDTQSLEQAIQADGDTPKVERKLGARVREWMASALGKAASGVWSIGISMAATTLTGLLGSYYGFPIT